MSRFVTIRGQKVDIGLKSEDLHPIRSRTPVRTGLLVSRFVVEDGIIVNDTYYGEMVERGTSRFAGRFMVLRSIPEIADRLANRVARSLDDVQLLDLPKSR